MLPSAVIGLMQTGELYQTARTCGPIPDQHSRNRTKKKKLSSAPVCDIADIMGQDQTSQMNMEVRVHKLIGCYNPIYGICFARQQLDQCLKQGSKRNNAR